MEYIEVKCCLFNEKVIRTDEKDWYFLRKKINDGHSNNQNLLILNFI